MLRGLVSVERHVELLVCRIEVNFGQREPWFTPPMPGFTFIDNLPLQNRVRGMLSLPRKVDCEVISTVSLCRAFSHTTSGLESSCLTVVYFLAVCRKW